MCIASKAKLFVVVHLIEQKTVMQKEEGSEGGKERERNVLIVKQIIH
jgi:hypothetical protein